MGFKGVHRVFKQFIFGAFQCLRVRGVWFQGVFPGFAGSGLRVQEFSREGVGAAASEEFQVLVGLPGGV